MNRSTKVLVLPILLVLLITLIPLQASAKGSITTGTSTNTITVTDPKTAKSPISYDLVAGGGNGVGTLVGNVTIWSDGSYLFVQYNTVDQTKGTDLTDDWYITETHLEVATSVAGIPQKNGNPIPGKFAYKNTHNYVTSYTYKVSLNQYSSGQTLYIAAHAVVNVPNGLKGLELSLPDTANIYAVRTSTSSYLMTYLFNGGNLQGWNNGWCVDKTRGISQYTIYNVDVYSSYETLPVGAITYPSNLPKVNWILNNIAAGQKAADGTVYTFGDIEMAIWSLVSPTGYTFYVGSYNPAHVGKIVDAANYYGASYKPGPGEYAAVVLIPVDSDGKIVAQVNIIKMVVPSYTASETAWGCIRTSDGLTKPFSGSNWATYFTFDI